MLHNACYSICIRISDCYQTKGGFICAHQSQMRHEQGFAEKKGLFNEMVTRPGGTGELTLKGVAP